MRDLPRLHALLRDRRDWRADLTGLVADAAGDLRLRPLPGVAGLPGIDLAPPFDPAPSGIAVAPCGDVILSDGEADRVLIDFPSGARASLGMPGSQPGEFRDPAGLALAGERLSVADAGNGRLQTYHLPDLGLGQVASTGGAPISLAADGLGRVVVADRAAPAVRRRLANGAADAGFDATVATAAAAEGGWLDPAFVAAGAVDMILVSDLGRGEVIVLDADGGWLGPLDPPPGGWVPGALLAAGEVLFVADRGRGTIRAMEATTGAWLGELTGWRGPVAAMALAPDGALLVKPGPGPQYHRLAPDAGVAEIGVIAAGPADAGLENGWMRLGIDADLPSGAGIAAEAGLGPEADPLAALWGALPGLRALLDLHGPTGIEDRRFARLRIEVTRGTSRHGPVLRQVALSTTGEQVIDSLPRVYAREDGQLSDDPGTSPRALLRRFLELLASDLVAGEARLDGLAQSLTTSFARPEVLDALAEWLALDFPLGADDDTRRGLLARAVTLHARRGTPASIREMAALHAGAGLSLSEAYRERGIWLLDDSSQLGFDTMLPPVDPEGLVIEGDLPVSSGDCTHHVGHAVVGETMPLAAADIFEPLFTEWAHRFTATTTAGVDRATLAAVIEREKPAHTVATLCIADPGLRVGVQADLGIDAIVANGPPAGPLGAARLDRDLVLGPEDAADEAMGIGRIGSARLGVDTGLG